MITVPTNCDAVNEFHQQGFIILKNFIEPEVIHEVRTAVQDIAEDHIHVLIGPADSAIVSVAPQLGADLIVTGPSDATRNEPRGSLPCAAADDVNAIAATATRIRRR